VLPALTRDVGRVETGSVPCAVTQIQPYAQVGKLMDEEDMSVVGYALSGRPTGYRWGKDYGIETIIICTGPPGSCATVLHREPN